MIFLVVFLGLVYCYQIYKDQKGAKERFELQMAMSEAQAKMTSPLTFDNCMSIINKIIQFYCLTEDVNRGYYTKTPEEFSLEMDNIVINIAMMSRMALSQEVVRQFGKFATNDGDDSYLEYYILNTTKIILMDEINNRRQITKQAEPNVPRVSRTAEKRNQNTQVKR